MSAAALLSARVAFFTAARPSVSYVRGHGIDWTTAEKATGGIFLARIVTDRAWFDFDMDGFDAAVCEVRDDYGERVVDLLAWSVDDPHSWWTAVGAGVMLGEAWAANPNTGLCGEPLRIFRTPLAWLQGDCAGIVLLDPARAGRWLLDSARTVAAEDRAHAAEVHRLMKAAGPKIFVRSAA